MIESAAIVCYSGLLFGKVWEGLRVGGVEDDGTFGSVSECARLGTLNV